MFKSQLPFAIFLVVFYFIPFIYVGLVQDNMRDWIVNFSFSSYTVIALLLFFFFYLLTSNLQIRTVSFKENFFLKSKPLIVFSFLLSVYFINTFDINFRYTNTDVSSSWIIILIYTLRIYIKYLSLLIFLKIVNVSFLFKILILFFLIFTSTSTFELSSSIFISIIFLYPTLIQSRKQIILKGFSFSFIFIAIIFFGFINKIGLASSKNVIDLYGDFFIQIILERFSTYIIAPINILEGFELKTYYIHIMNEFNYSINNLFKLFGYNLKLNDPWSINRFSYLEIVKIPDKNSGASPGLIGSLIASGFFFPLIIFYVLYVKSILLHVLRKINLNIFGAILFSLSIISPLFLSPISSLNIFSPSGIELIFFLLFSSEITKHIASEI